MKNYFVDILNSPKIRNENENKLDLDNYLINPELHEDLFKYNSFPKLESNSIDLYKGVYIVKFKILNNSKDEKVLVYNYIFYNHRLYLSLVVFFILRNYFIRSLGYKEWGYYSIILDNEFLLFDNVKHYIEFSNKSDSTGINENWLFSDIQEQLRSHRSNQDLMFYLELITKLIYVTDTGKMCDILKYGYNKDFVSYFKLVYNMTNEEFGNMNIGIINSNYSILNSSVFVIHDFKEFIKKLKDCGFNVNQGPQKWRGQINSMSSFLSILDMDYRESLFNHYYHHSGKLSFDKYKYNLERKHFSFNNIHNNIGNVRWYSTSSRRLETRKFNNRQELYDESYDSIGNILESNRNLSKFDIQLQVETFLRSQEKVYFDQTTAKKILSFSENNYDIIKDKLSDLELLMSNWDSIKKNSKVNAEEYVPWIRKIVKELGSKKVATMLVELFMFLLSKETINIHEFNTPGIPTTEVYNLFGRRLIDKYIFSKYSNYKNSNNSNITLSQYKDLNSEEFKDIYEDNFYARFAGSFVWTLNTVSLIYEDLDYKSNNLKETQLYIRVNQEIRKLFIKDNYKVYHLPLKLPMVCEPKDFIYTPNTSNNQLGGYLLNDVEFTDYIFKEKIGYGQITTLKEENSIVDLINGLSKTPYRINQEVLDYIYTYGIEKGILIDITKEDIKSFIANPYKNKKITKRDRKKYVSILSKIVMEKNILSIADTYSKIDKIYFPVRLDFRTRIYCETVYFDYQKSDLAKGLILFSNPGYFYKHNTDVIKYFKAYGANMFGDSLDKKSLNYRVKWIDDNSSRILNFENNDIISLAENKTCFLAFCFEYKRFIEFMDNIDSVKFYTYLPIQLDATCNGYQHLALLTKEASLFNKLNLDYSTHDDNPDDFYSYILHKTEEYIKSQIGFLTKLDKLSERDEKLLKSYKTLSELKLDRSLVKKSIMTKSYNASLPRRIEQIIENLDQVFEGNQIYYTYKGSIKFKRFDVTTFVTCTKKVIDMESPRISELSKYLDSIVGICTKLSIPVPWKLPSGALINESYYEVEKKKIKAFAFVKSRYTFKKYLKDKYNLAKQKRATMPNWIHSLDATTIALLYEDFKKVGHIYTIHDCFGVTADNVPKLISMLKLVYMKLYSNNGYLSQFDELVRLTINGTFGDAVFKKDDNFIYLPNGSKYKKEPFPDVNKIISLNNNIDSINKSSYLLI